AIERAKGILMQSQGLTESQSFDLLSEISQRYRRKLRDVAADIAGGSLALRITGDPQTGELPERAVPDGRSRSRSNGQAKSEPA
ncbi:MAG TPA: ANTAR domain-containing protein, partial [Blastococcus sp.]